MAATNMFLDRSAEDVFAVLGDPWRFADWVVGAKVIRDVDANWPAIGSRFHHRFGVGPLSVDDSTVLEEHRAPHRIVLRARARPTGVARVTLDLVPVRGGTEVHMDEVPISGIARTIDNPVLEALLLARNRRSLHRLAELVRAAAPAGR